MSDEDDGDGGGMLAGFLFGNIDESGQLEDDILDEVSYDIGPGFTRRGPY